MLWHNVVRDCDHDRDCGRDCDRDAQQNCDLGVLSKHLWHTEHDPNMGSCPRAQWTTFKKLGTSLIFEKCLSVSVPRGWKGFVSLSVSSNYLGTCCLPSGWLGINSIINRRSYVLSIPQSIVKSCFTGIFLNWIWFIDTKYTYVYVHMSLPVHMLLYVLVVLITYIAPYTNTWCIYHM